MQVRWEQWLKDPGSFHLMALPSGDFPFILASFIQWPERRENDERLYIQFLNTSIQKWSTSFSLTFRQWGQRIRFTDIQGSLGISFLSGSCFPATAPPCERGAWIFGGQPALSAPGSHHKGGALNNVNKHMCRPGLLCCWKIDKNHVISVIAIGEWRLQRKQNPKAAGWSTQASQRRW